MPALRRKRSGNATIEFVLVGIPLMFVLISTCEMARGMWIYHTLAYAVKEGARYTVTRGQNSPNKIKLSVICTYIVQQGTGLIDKNLNLTFTSASGPLGPYAADCSVSGCSGNSQWPPDVDNQPGQTITITATYPFQSAIAMFWPGKTKGMSFAAMNFPTQAAEVMQF
jgi:Flp pilus assembly protein TadG